MQLRGWDLTRTSRIVLILLVVQHLGLSQILVVASASAMEPDAGHRSRTVLPDAIAPSAVVGVPTVGASTTHEEPGSQTIPPDPGPLPRRLPRAPPAR
jgi:hypothetical protein